MRIDLSASTRGELMSGVDYERIDLFGRPLRNRIRINLERNPESTFFGIGNDTDYLNRLYDEGVYFLLKKQAFLSMNIRKKLLTIPNHNDEDIIEAVLRLQGSYSDLSGKGADTRFVIEPPPGAEGGWVNTIGVGVIADNRDSEFKPRTGIMLELGANLSSPIIASDFLYSDYFLDARFFAPLLWDVILAQRVEMQHSIGNVPFWEMPVIGNQNALRGYPLNRFIGDSSVLYMLELRKWLFSFLEDEIKVGGHFFTDNGRVFSDFDSPDFFDEWKNTWGFGGSLSVFNQDLVLRGEVGFSKDDYRIYAGIGYAF